jgi:hypothetical protein
MSFIFSLILFVAIDIFFIQIHFAPYTMIIPACSILMIRQKQTELFLLSAISLILSAAILARIPVFPILFSVSIAAFLGRMFKRDSFYTAAAVAVISTCMQYLVFSSSFIVSELIFACAFTALIVGAHYGMLSSRKALLYAESTTFQSTKTW